MPVAWIFSTRFVNNNHLLVIWRNQLQRKSRSQKLLKYASQWNNNQPLWTTYTVSSFLNSDYENLHNSPITFPKTLSRGFVEALFWGFVLISSWICVLAMAGYEVRSQALFSELCLGTASRLCPHTITVHCLCQTIRCFLKKPSQFRCFSHALVRGFAELQLRGFGQIDVVRY